MWEFELMSHTSYVHIQGDLRTWNLFLIRSANLEDENREWLEEVLYDCHCGDNKSMPVYMLPHCEPSKSPGCTILSKSGPQACTTLGSVAREVKEVWPSCWSSVLHACIAASLLWSSTGRLLSSNLVGLMLPAGTAWSGTLSLYRRESSAWLVRSWLNPFLTILPNGAYTDQFMAQSLSLPHTILIGHERIACKHLSILCGNPTVALKVESKQRSLSSIEVNRELHCLHWHECETSLHKHLSFTKFTHDYHALSEDKKMQLI